ncbi:hypothetical protein FACS1894102_2650 [Spirochaetia bacterium]|nr:hypothetical protein FACS1894102_2650 [Spirochaetia bacterium]
MRSNTALKKAGLDVVVSGFNTDTIGFSESLLHFINKKNFKGMSITVIGAGGASRAVVSELSRLKAHVLILNRNPKRALELAKKYKFESGMIDTDGLKRVKKFSDIIINTTSVGMEKSGTENNDPISQFNFSGKEVVMDIIYKPSMTPLLKRASAKGCRVINGYDMLLRQAKCQYKFFFNEEYPEHEHA